MGSKNSKLKPMYYTCHEIAHTWHPSCTWVALEIAESCFWEALKIYGAVYGVSTMLKGKIPSREQMRTLIWNTIQSSLFLSVNTGGYISAVCLLRRIIGSFNYYTLGWLGAVISSFLAILVERPSRRSLLAVYVSNVATESLLHSYVQDGTLPSIPHGEVLTFAGVSAICMYLFKSKLKRNEIAASKEKDKTNSNDHEDILLKLIRLLVGKSEQTYSHDEREPLMKYVGKIVLGFWSKREPKRGQSVCGHTEESCVAYGLKGSIVPFAMGQALQAGLFALPMIQGRSRNGLSTILSHISRPDVLLWSCFLGSFPAVYKLASCFLRNALGVDHRWNAIPAGFLAGLTMAFSPSRSMCLYSVWKTLEIVCTKGVQNGTLPRIPLGVEILYASSTSVLLHLGVVSPQSLKPSYWKFVSRITGDRFLEVNRPLVDHTYNVRASALLPNFEPRFPRPDLISAECQAIGQEFKGKYNTFSL